MHLRVHVLKAATRLITLRVVRVPLSVVLERSCPITVYVDGSAVVALNSFRSS